MWWELIIMYGVYGTEPTKLVRRSNAVKGFEWDNIGGDSGAYEFADSDGSWNAVFTNVVWFTEERFEGEDKKVEVEQTGQEEATGLMWMERYPTTTTAQTGGESQGEETRL